MLLTQTIVSEGHCARTCCSDASSPALVGAGADSAEFGSVVGVVGVAKEAMNPDWGAGGAGRAAGAKPPRDGTVEVSRARQSFRNCVQVSPFLVPAAFAVCHSAPHCFMTPSASAVLTDTGASMIVATPVNRVNETRVV